MVKASNGVFDALNIELHPAKVSLATKSYFEDCLVHTAVHCIPATQFKLTK